ncbi:hypothetical protein ES703_31257 [subsurface metagenome]
MELYPLIFRLINLTRDGRHFLPGTPIDDGYLVSTKALGGSGGIHRCITATNDRYSLAQTDFISRIDPLQEINGVNYLWCALTGNAHFLAHSGASTKENSLISLAEEPVQVFHRAIRSDFNAEFSNIINLVI